jgi:hypothetical protein
VPDYLCSGISSISFTIAVSSELFGKFVTFLEHHSNLSAHLQWPVPFVGFVVEAFVGIMSTPYPWMVLLAVRAFVFGLVVVVTAARLAAVPAVGLLTAVSVVIIVAAAAAFLAAIAICRCVTL